MNNKNGKPNVVCIGGGTGTFVSLSGLKHYPCNLSVIVTMSDSGGSNKRLRDEFGLLPTSDIRQCLIALSDENGGVGLLRKLFMYRFDKGSGISGMTFGNLFMAALTDIVGSQEDAIKQTAKVLRINGTIIPVSFTDTNLYAEYEDGTILKEEHLIDEPPHDGKLKIDKVYLKPKAIANPEAIKAIKDADIVVLGPGDLFTSIIPNLLVEDISKALMKTKAKIVYVMNLMTKNGQTYNFKASDHIKTLEKFIGKSIDYVLINSKKLPKNLLKLYEKEKDLPVLNDLQNNEYYKVILGDIVSDIACQKSSSDTLVRSLIRHDSKKLARNIMNVLIK